MRPALVVAVVVLALVAAACGTSAARRTPIAFGITGGNVRGYSVTIQPDGSVHSKGSQPGVRRQLVLTRVRQLEREIQQAHLTNRQCGGVLPDIASRYVRVGGRTVTVHGDCEAGFERVWDDLAQAVALRSL
ncbi:MAG: hypothetical protein E6G12_12050 [Actinobacteria bacterium]|nr:MAG: hypothetical protein E6G12_12050 [Actinomycetota bacterium]